MKKVIIITTSVVLTVVLSIALLVFAFFQLNPFWKSNEEIKKDLLNITPIGTSIDDVTPAVKSKYTPKQGGSIINNGYKIDEQGDIYNSQLDKSYTVVGEKSIFFHFGKRWLEHVFVYYAFDENDELIDILVYKEVDLP